MAEDLITLERPANLGYFALKLETAKATVIQPDTFVPLYSEDIAINLNTDEDNPIVGIREARFDSFRGQEDYQGPIKVLAEPKTLPHFLNMLLTKGTSTGTASTGYTHPFTLGDTVKSYTIEFLKGNIPFRFFGVEASAITPAFEDNKMVLDITISALGQFSVAKIQTATGTEVILEDERPNPTKGLTTDDSLRLYDVSAEEYEDVEISSINADGKTLIMATAIAGSYETGDICWLKPLTSSYTIVAPFSWGRTEFRFGTGSAVALDATQTRLEKGSNWNLINAMEEEAGAKRSGEIRPDALVRTQGDIEITLKKFFKDGQDHNRFLQGLSRALVVRHFSPAHAGTDLTEAELRITVSEYKIRENTVPLATGEIVYGNLVLIPKYKTADAQMFEVEVINSLQGSTYE